MAGGKQHEIAAVLKIPIGTVGKRIHDARAKLKKALRSLLLRRER
jgi:DNA-directed RNA polymerase specialized sigma24 family protein